jgi:DNA-binding SARP family transcriptional activator/tetratricopeptide (TPR) repeat protein
MRFSILGPLSVTDAGDNVPITAGRDRVVLAMLLLNPNRILSPDELIDAIWGESPPATARGQLQTCVSRLRRILPPGAITTDPAGYGLSLGPDDLDAEVFGRLITSARATTDEDRARQLYQQALDLWRGSALAGTESDAVRHAAAVLDEKRAVAIEDWAETELSVNGARELTAGLTAELAALVERFPLRERLRGQLMLSLHRSGRQADALAEYRRARQLLRDELGIEPSPELQELHRRLLAGEEAAAPSPAASVRCLPRTVADFTGRGEIVRRVVGAIEDGAPAGPVVAVLDGMAGSGKTTLALHVASLVTARYPDAQLFVDLHGHSEHEPVRPATALLTLLRQLGVPPARIPTESAERIDLWRIELATRRTLVVFDNAASSSQVADLLPTSPGSLALVTSRRRLSGLDGVHTESLAVLDQDEAITLLGRIAGDRVAAEPESAAEVVRRCGHLPLAIRLAGARLAHRPHWRVADLVHRLGESVLSALAVEDRTVASAFALSYGQLAPPTQRMFRLLGVHPGGTFDPLAAAALAGLSLDEATGILDDLVDVHLIDEPEPEVFRLHDLLREYASALAAETPEESRAALVAALDLQLHAVLAAVPAERRATTVLDVRPAEPMRPDLLAALSDPDARLERERPALGAFVEAAVAAERPEYAWQLPRAAWRPLWSRGYIGDIAALQLRAMQVAEDTGDRSAAAMSANYLASAYFRSARYDEARHLLETNIPVRRESGDTSGLVAAMGNLTAVYEALGRYVESADLAAEALRIARTLDDLNEVSPLLNNMAMVYGIVGRYAEAMWYQRLRLMVVSRNGDRNGMADSFLHLAHLKRRAGVMRPRDAQRGLRAALRLFRAGHNLFGESEARNELAQVLRSQGRHREALTEHRLALDIVRRIGDRRFESQFLNELAVTVLATGDVDEARRLHEQALSLARAIPHLFEQASAHRGLGDCLVDTDRVAARGHWQHAHELYTRMQVPERFEVEARLSRLSEAAAPPLVGGDVLGHLRWGDRSTKDGRPRSRSGVDPLLPR